MTNNKGQSAFSRLSPFIQEYIYKNRWDELRPIQEEACKVIFDTDDHLILASGTASGKTEAAFLPILTLLEADPPASAGVLYIAPMKALINDQFERLVDLLDSSGIPVCHWHGDVPQSKKTKFLKNPGGVLQITPESLEAMLTTRVQDLVRIFGDLRFVVIDEMHAFMSSERGLQVLCQLARLQRYMHTVPRRIGLSATLGDYNLPAAWLSAGTNRGVSIPNTGAIAQKIRLSVENFNREFAEEDPNLFEHPAVLYMYERTLNKKAIVFGNGRPTPDAAIMALRHQAKLHDTPDIYHVHHGAISSTLREAAEQDMKTSEGPVVIGATVTMELGVDIGR
ncbi:MAG: DEAD/DEAH box helicase, partial [Oscillospiraceae bacterium]|nr:DEAD/DEAH box helicase [Oscillospiraceae bacterium]